MTESGLFLSLGQFFLRLRLPSLGGLSAPSEGGGFLASGEPGCGGWWWMVYAWGTEEHVWSATLNHLSIPLPLKGTAAFDLLLWNSRQQTAKI